MSQRNLVSSINNTKLSSDITHAFDCDGLIRAIKIKDGAVWGGVASHYGLGPSFKTIEKMTTEKVDIKNNANTSLMVWQDR